MLQLALNPSYCKRASTHLLESKHGKNRSGREDIILINNTRLDIMYFCRFFFQDRCTRAAISQINKIVDKATL